MNEINWGLFEVGDIFKIVTGALLKSSDLKTGKIPRITATSYNNGISTFTNEMTHKNFRKFKNFISVSFLGDVFYQPDAVSLDMKIHGLKLKDRVLTKPLALYLIPLIKKFSKKYTYGNQLSSSVLARQKLSLPIKTDGTPDWEHMENSIEKQEFKSKKKVLSFMKEELEKVSDFENVSLNNVKWKEFKVIDVFESTLRGKRLTKANQSLGKTPYISSTSLDNGVDSFISDDMPSRSFRKFNNIITIANSGSVGSSFYHPYSIIASDHVTVLKFEKNNQYVAQFLITALKKIGSKYSFNREINDYRIKNERLMLPVNKFNKPDYEFMENYIKGIKYNSIIKTINFLES